MDATVEELTKLTEAISRVAPSPMGYSVRSLCQIDGEKIHNIFTVLKFSDDDRRGLHTEGVPGTKLQVIRMWVKLNLGNQAIADASDTRSFSLNSRKIDFFPDVRPYLWQENSDIWMRDNFSNYGIERPARVAFYTNGGSLPTVDKKNLLATGYDSLSDFIRFKLVSDSGAVKGYYPTFQNPGIFIVVPNWHASIENVEVIDSAAKITVRSYFGDSLYGHLKLMSKVYTRGGERLCT